ncbi:MAG: hypothetical protein M1820_009447 [Bogoriella megaspora]|nr:MAG: hypothetical protein M1820_009447 [Bogoriella megaspora]
MGKTMLSIFLTKRFEDDKLRNRDCLVLYYFCDGRNEERRTAVTILRGLIYSLLQQRPKLMDYLLPDFEVQQQSLFTERSFTALWRIFTSMIRHANAGPVYCLIDALNECNPDSRGTFYRQLRRDFLSELDDTSHFNFRRTKTVQLEMNTDLNNPDKSILKMIVVSRTAPESDMSSIPCIHIGTSQENLHTKETRAQVSEPQSTDKLDHQDAHLTDEETVVDDYEHQEDGDGHLEALLSYKEAKIRELFEAKGWTSDLIGEMTNLMEGKGNGTFLWVDLAITELKKAESEEDGKAIMTALPDTLNPMYRRIIARIPDERKHTAISLLSWVLCALRPLELSELREALELPQASENDQLERAVSDCAGLIAERDGVVKLVHHAAGDFLFGEELRNDPDVSIRKFAIDESRANGMIAQRCITYAEMIIADGALREISPIFKALSERKVIEKGVQKLQKLQKNLSPKKLFRSKRKGASLEQGGDETANAEDRATIELEEAATKVEDQKSLAKEITKRALGDYAILNWFHHCRRTDASFLNLSSPMFNDSFETRSDWLYLYWSDSFTNPKYLPWGLPPSSFTCLHMLAMLNLDSIAALKWEDGLKSQLNSQDSRLRKPLSYGVEMGHLEIVELLLSRGADLTCPKLTLLDLACANGHVAMAEKLLDSSSDPSRPLIAEPVTNDGVVHHIFSRLADDIFRKTHEIQDIQGQSNLMTNANRFFFLLNSVVGSNATNLHCAVFFGHADLAQKLLERGFDIEASTSNGYTPLLVGAHRGRQEIVTMLLDRGANIQTKTKDGWTLLHHAAFGGNKELLQLVHDTVLRAGTSDIDTVSTTKQTPLHAAAIAGRASCAEFLLSCKCFVDARSDNEYTPLHYAAEKNAYHSVEVVRLLVEADADLEAINSNGETPLHCTVKANNFHVLTILLWLGANEEAETTAGHKLLQLVSNREDRYKDPHNWFARNMITGAVGSANSVLTSTLSHAKESEIGRRLSTCSNAVERARLLNVTYESYAFKEFDPIEHRQTKDRYGLGSRIANAVRHIDGIISQTKRIIYEHETLHIAIIGEVEVVESPEKQQLIDVVQSEPNELSRERKPEISLVSR